MSGPAANPFADPVLDHSQWQRLDPLMLLVHPVKEVIRFLPAVIGIFVAGTATNGGGDRWWWNLLAIGVPVLLGLARYLTTSFRIANGRVELRRGLLSRHVLSTPLDRVRTVDITASLIHRLLGLTTVRIGTGTASKSEDDELDLDGIRADTARRLRADLLHTTPEARVQAEVEGNERDVVTFDPGWLRYAPFTSTGLIMAGAVVGFGSQLIDTLGIWDRLDLESTVESAARLSLLIVVPLAALVVMVIASVFSVVGYAVTNWGFRLSHTRSDGVWHLRRGLFTTRETSMDGRRMRGVSVGEPFGLRLVSGAKLSAIVTGLDREDGGSSLLVPPAPRRVVERVAADVIGSTDPLTVNLIGHGPAASRRRFSRALLLPVLLCVALVVLIAVDLLPIWTLSLGVIALLGGVVLAIDRVRSLGHALAGGQLVSRSGSLMRRRTVLDADAVIGWNLRATWFQRRAGLTTLVATMAGGPQSVSVLDVPQDEAVRVADRAVPGLVSQFFHSGG